MLGISHGLTPAESIGIFACNESVWLKEVREEGKGIVAGYEARALSAIMVGYKARALSAVIANAELGACLCRLDWRGEGVSSISPLLSLCGGSEVSKTGVDTGSSLWWSGGSLC
jgi:hypothetical protein